jgi:hypothetical protein
VVIYDLDKDDIDTRAAVKQLAHDAASNVEVTHKLEDLEPFFIGKSVGLAAQVQDAAGKQGGFRALKHAKRSSPDKVAFIELAEREAKRRELMRRAIDAQAAGVSYRKFVDNNRRVLKALGLIEQVKAWWQVMA